LKVTGAGKPAMDEATCCLIVHGFGVAGGLNGLVETRFPKPQNLKSELLELIPFRRKGRGAIRPARARSGSPEGATLWRGSRAEPGGKLTVESERTASPSLSARTGEGEREEIRIVHKDILGMALAKLIPFSG